MTDRQQLTSELERAAADRARRLEARRRGAAKARRDALRAATAPRVARERRQGPSAR
jgi:hypothetical protein